MPPKRNEPDRNLRSGKKKTTKTLTELDRPPAVRPRPGVLEDFTYLPPCFMPTEGILKGVAARSSTDIWAVGYAWDHKQNDSHRPLTMHWDGRCWSEVPCPNMASSAELHAVCVVPPDGAFAVGFYWDIDQPGPPPVPFAVRWDAKAKQWLLIPPKMELQTDYYLYGVSGTSAQDVWAVGNIVDWRGQPHIQHWDGNAWSVVQHPMLGVPGGHSGVTALAPDQAFVVGGVGDPVTLVQRWDGRQWTVIASPNAPDTRMMFGQNGLYGVAARNADDLCAVGLFIPAEKPSLESLILESHVVDQWKTVRAPPVPGAQQLDRHMLRGVALDPDDGAWAVGINDVPGMKSRPLVMHRDNGGPWQLMTDNPRGTGGGLFGVAAVTKTDVWAVGWYSDPNWKYEFCLFEHWDGNNWRSFP